MVDEYPSIVPTFKVVGRLTRGVIDNNDAGQGPQLLPIVGATITFTPSLNPPWFTVRNAVPPVTIFQESIVATTDSQGFLVAPDDPTPGVLLVYGGSTELNPTNWTWNVKVEPGGNFPSKEFSIMGSDGAVIDLASYFPVAENPGEEVVFWQAAVDEVLAIKQDVIDEKDSMVVGGSVISKHLMLQRYDGVTFDAGIVGGADGVTPLVGNISVLPAGSSPTITERSVGSTKYWDFGLVPGPNNVLSIGSVTQVAYDAAATASITGASPSQQINFSIPKGRPPQVFAVDTEPTSALPGDIWVPSSPSVGPTDKQLYGSGMPNGVVTAPIGTMYTDMVGTNGAWTWQKRSGAGNTGWVCIEGYTGVRKITSEIQVYYPAMTGDAYVYRVNDRVYFRTLNLANGVFINSKIWDIPTGFWLFDPVGANMPTALLRAAMNINGDPLSGAANIRTSGKAAICMRNDTPSQAHTGEMHWVTTDSWPTSLPGIAYP